MSPLIGTLRLRGTTPGAAGSGTFRRFCRVNAAFLSPALSWRLVVVAGCARAPRTRRSVARFILSVRCLFRQDCRRYVRQFNDSFRRPATANHEALITSDKIPPAHWLACLPRHALLRG